MKLLTCCSACGAVSKGVAEGTEDPGLDGTFAVELTLEKLVDSRKSNVSITHV